MHVALVALDPPLPWSTPTPYCWSLPSPLQALLAIPLVGLYMGGASVVRLIENGRNQAATTSA